MYGAVAHKRFFLYALGLIYKKTVAQVKIGAQGRMTLLKQNENNRYCLNMTYASPVRRGCAEIIEDIVPIYNIPVTLNVKETVKQVYSAYDKEQIAFTQGDGYITFTVPKLECHKIIVIDY
jgi:hypothetical protein